MNRNQMKGKITKDILKCRLLKIKNDLYNGTMYDEWTAEQKWSAQRILTHALDIFDEYRL